MTARRKSPESLADKVKHYFRVKDSIARGYKRADKLEAELKLEMLPGVPVKLSEFENAILSDNSLEKDDGSWWRSHKCSRFELKKVKA